MWVKDIAIATLWAYMLLTLIPAVPGFPDGVGFVHSQGRMRSSSDSHRTVQYRAVRCEEQRTKQMTNNNQTLLSAVATLAIDSDNDLNLTTLSPDTIGYLLEYGLNKTLQDASAGAIKLYSDAHAAGEQRGKAHAKLFDSGCELIGREGDDAERMTSADFGKAVAQAKRAARLAALIAGTMRASGLGNRLSGLDRIARDVAVEMIRAAAKARGVKLPDVDKLAEMAAALVAKNPAVMVEAERRQAMASTAIDLDSLA
jgi:hypothetical protein